MKLATGLIALILSLSVQVFASQGLVIHSEEFGVGKFHRMDNSVHPYGAKNAWLPYVMPATAPSDHVSVQHNADGSYTIFFSTLEELMQTVVSISQQLKTPVSVLNVHGHGLPGGMWFPKDAKTWHSYECDGWREAAEGNDRANYDQYYGAVTKDQVMQIRAMSDVASSSFMGCVTGVDEWKEVEARNPAFKTVLADDAQLHFLSCVVGLGKAGAAFTQGIADLLLKAGAHGRVETSTNFGLGDWSMAQGMGFWDYVSDTQIDHDGQIYPVNRRDSEVAQKGTIRMVEFTKGGWTSQLLGDRDAMNLGFSLDVMGTPVPEMVSTAMPRDFSNHIRIPGTAAYVDVYSK